MKNRSNLILLILTLILFSCSKEENINDTTNANNDEEIVNFKPFTVVNNKLSFESKETLSDFILNTDKESFRKTIMSLNTQGFNTLRPYFNGDQENELVDFIASKKALIAKKGYLYSLKDEDDDVDLDDEVITDDGLASLLNEDREIYVGNTYYKYTTQGLYFCKRKYEDDLKEYLKELGSKITSKNDIKVNKCKQYYKSSGRESGAVSLSPVSGTVTQVTPTANLYQSCTGGGGGGSGGSGGSGGGSSSSDNYPMLIPQSFGSCVYSEDSIWQQVFGARVKCNDYHDSTHRVQTQFWNENYFIFSSIGTKAKYQKKRLIGWSESETAEFVELGVNNVNFTYNHVVKQYNPFGDHHIKFKYKGVTYSKTGQPISFPANPNPWPIYNKDQNLLTLEIFIDDILGKQINEEINLTGANVNSAVKDLLKAAANAIPSTFGLNNDLDNNKVSVKIVKFSTNKTNLLVLNRVARDKSNETFRFDFNFLLTYDVDQGEFANFFKQFKATKYDVMDLNVYGAALRNGVWKGKRIIGAE